MLSVELQPSSASANPKNRESSEAFRCILGLLCHLAWVMRDYIKRYRCRMEACNCSSCDAFAPYCQRSGGNLDKKGASPAVTSAMRSLRAAQMLLLLTAGGSTGLRVCFLFRCLVGLLLTIKRTGPSAVRRAFCSAILGRSDALAQVERGVYQRDV